MMKFYKIKVLDEEELDVLISDLLELALERKNTDTTPLIRLVQLLHESEAL